MFWRHSLLCLFSIICVYLSFRFQCVCIYIWALQLPLLLLQCFAMRFPNVLVLIKHLIHSFFRCYLAFCCLLWNILWNIWCFVCFCLQSRVYSFYSVVCIKTIAITPFTLYLYRCNAVCVHILKFNIYSFAWDVLQLLFSAIHITFSLRASCSSYRLYHFLLNTMLFYCTRKFHRCMNPN